MSDSGERYRMELSNGALIHFPTTRPRSADPTITLTREQLLHLLGGAGIMLEGDPSVLARLMSLTDNPDHDFPIVTP